MSPVRFVYSKSLFKSIRKQTKGLGAETSVGYPQLSPHYLENCSEELVEQEKAARNGAADLPNTSSPPPRGSDGGRLGPTPGGTQARWLSEQEDGLGVTQIWF